MKHIIIFAIILMISGSITAQNFTEEDYRMFKDSQPLTEKTSNVVPEAKEFVDYGYRYKFITYLLQNVRYPTELIQKGVQGKVVVETVITTEGELTKIKVVQGIHPLLDNEVLRVMNEMPKGIFFKSKKDWKYTFPIVFEIKDNRVQISM